MVKDFDCLKPETQRILEEVRAVPYGQVSSYREIAVRAGLVNGARQVARALNGLSEIHQLPWWRIIRSDGSIALHGQERIEQIRLLRLEGVKVDASGKLSKTESSSASPKPCKNSH